MRRNGYDQPGITNPENVDALTHQQIYDAFQTVDDHTSEVVTAWQQAGTQWRESTTQMVQAVRTAVDGRWSGASADAAVQALSDYGTQAGQLSDLFQQTGQVVADTALAAVTTKAYVPKPVPVTADQTKDPTGYDGQSRAAQQAQDDARLVMQQRYLIPLLDQDARLPHFPPAASPVSDGLMSGSPAAGPLSGLMSGTDGFLSGTGGLPTDEPAATTTASANGNSHPFGTGSPGSTLFGGLPGTTGTETDSSSSVFGGSTSKPTRPGHTTPSGYRPAATSPGGHTPGTTSSTGDSAHDTPGHGAEQSSTDTPRHRSDQSAAGNPYPAPSEHSAPSLSAGSNSSHAVPDSPRYDPDISTVAPQTTAQPALTNPSGWSDSQLWSESHAGNAGTAGSGSPATTQPGPANTPAPAPHSTAPAPQPSVPAPSAPPASPAPVAPPPPVAPGPAPAPVPPPAATLPAPPGPSVPAPSPSAPAVPLPPSPAPLGHTPTPYTPAPHVPAPGAPVPKPLPPAPPPPAPNPPAPAPNPSAPAPRMPVFTPSAPDLTPYTTAGGAAVTGAAAHALSDTPDGPARTPRIRVGYQGDVDRRGMRFDRHKHTLDDDADTPTDTTTTDDSTTDDSTADESTADSTTIDEGRADAALPDSAVLGSAVLGSAVLGSAVLGSAVLGSAVLGSAVLGSAAPNTGDDPRAPEIIGGDTDSAATPQAESADPDGRDDPGGAGSAHDDTAPEGETETADATPGGDPSNDDRAETRAGSAGSGLDDSPDKYRNVPPVIGE
ncbi:hypothetical protein [Nocardia sp. BMG51109]|uniref:hypothetical protein n=1 Tax=Nocardia sp. BMG51109 TaxID=1056816 RepID=UPI00046745B1|nr:hypothetical protein [Nocardia sp. BMG51109]